MLVLTRRVGERICIGADIVITVTAIDSQRVRIGIEAPKSVSVLRQELWQRYETEECGYDEVPVRPTRMSQAISRSG